MRFSFAPSIQEAGGLENTLSAPCKQWEAKNGGHLSLTPAEIRNDGIWSDAPADHETGQQIAQGIR
jgi:hypothetical protein